MPQDTTPVSPRKSRNWVTLDMAETGPSRYVYSKLLPDAPACYVVYCDGNLSYVGQTTSLKKRIYSYDIRSRYSNAIFTPWGQFDSVVLKYRPARRYGDWAMIELRLIKRLQPIYNCVGSVKKRSSPDPLRLT